MSQELIDYSRKALIFAVQLLGSQTDAEDVVQASVEKALAHPKAPKGGIDLQKWLYRVVRNAAIDRIRQLSRADELDTEQQSSSTQSPERQLEQLQIKTRLMTALNALPLMQRELIVLRDYHGNSYEDIAEILAIPAGTVMSRLHRARMALRELLKNELNEVNHESV
ncbi:sigma-70 family RNA polymerase sigma factor [Kangiella sp.]|uniref:RNA polymerase sigma factor n=1 Tax=Kangiella sp. TaxID=1920245 RepID=UPI0019CCE38D|nr:sigma-70 family RNA polymerase sigma factor [Kangiella sp.]MBD3654064.1 sigma-70 family RNA polymerase sigma factor [Kangiella sp.]